jgi:hypothetical protein
LKPAALFTRCASFPLKIPSPSTSSRDESQSKR